MVSRAHAARALLTGVRWVAFRTLQHSSFPDSLDKVPVSMVPRVNRLTRHTSALVHPVGPVSSATSKWFHAKMLPFARLRPCLNFVAMEASAKILATVIDAFALKVCLFLSSSIMIVNLKFLLLFFYIRLHGKLLSTRDKRMRFCTMSKRSDLQGLNRFSLVYLPSRLPRSQLRVQHQRLLLEPLSEWRRLP